MIYNCKNCDSPMVKWGSKPRTILDIGNDGIPVRKTLKNQRWRCNNCLKITSETIGGANGGLASNEIKNKIALSCFKNGFSNVAKEFEIDEKTTRSIWKEWAGNREEDMSTPHFLGISSINITGVERTLITNIETMTIIDLLEDDHESLKNWIHNKSNINNITTVAIGFHPKHLEIVKQLIPNTEIIILKEHVIDKILSLYENRIHQLDKSKQWKTGCNNKINIHLFTLQGELSEWQKEEVMSWDDEYQDLYRNKENIIRGIQSIDIKSLKLESENFKSTYPNVMVNLIDSWSSYFPAHNYNSTGYNLLLSKLDSNLTKKKLTFILIRGLLILYTTERYWLKNEESEDDIMTNMGVSIEHAINAMNIYEQTLI